MSGSEKYTNDFKLDAIAWKCRETGLSYGKLICQYSAAEIKEIYVDYQKILDERRMKINHESKTSRR